MPSSGVTRANQNKKIRQKALREQLEAQGHVQHVTDILDKMSNPQEEIDANIITRYKVTLDTKMKLIGKYLPDLKAQDINVEGAMNLGVIDMSGWSDEQIDEYIAKHSK